MGRGSARPPSAPARGPHYRALLLVALAVLVLDQLSKWWVAASLEGQQPAYIIEGFLRLRYTENRGAAFGIFQGWTAVLSIAAAAVIVAILYSVAHLGGGRLGALAVGLIVGGALGNLIDRVRLGYVVDFVDVYSPSVAIGGSTYSFPVFNVADSGITVGAVLLAALFLFAREEQPQAAAGAGEGETPTREAYVPITSPSPPTPAGWAGLIAMLAGLFLMAVRLATRRT